MFEMLVGEVETNLRLEIVVDRQQQIDIMCSV